MPVIQASRAAILTLVECAYLFYMFFFFKTRYALGQARYEQDTQRLGRMFVHDTGHYENKVCAFGKMVALVAIALAVGRFHYATAERAGAHATTMQIGTLLCGGVCAVAAFHMNLTAFVYILPLLVAEVGWVYLLERIHATT